MWPIDSIKTKLSRVGFSMEETMTGHHRFEEGCGPPGKHFMEFRGVWGPSRILEWMTPSSDRFLWQEFKGVVTVGELCENAPMQGFLEMKYAGEHKIRYTFDFEAGGKAYRYTGEKVNIRPWNLPVSHTTCFGNIVETDSGRLISTSVTFFKLMGSFKFLGSFRITRSEQDEASKTEESSGSASD